uniref:Small ribosomal subunit protein bS20c n=1 Tax=Schizocladia ischiensis TaxID=196139 RepID=A0A7S6U9W4_9STRA|nr:ribosomal protein S20 [Schizocladia ischiensis]QOW07521.1 ribosomal protein S20 [Schizocladia ischiensis]
MANTNSARKRIKINERNRIQNGVYRSMIKTFTKKYYMTVDLYKVSPTTENKTLIKESLNLVYSKIDKATKKKVIHKNNAARKKARLFKTFLTIC